MVHHSKSDSDFLVFQNMFFLHSNIMETCVQLKKVLSRPQEYWEFFKKYKITFRVMLNKIVFEWVGPNSHSMN